jgi:nucleotidyltransferase substrate binding protein (TIGR01987 family)
VENIQGSRDAFRLAFERGLISEGEIWMDMIKKRQLTSHTYNEDVVVEIMDAIVNHYYQQFIALRDALVEQLPRDE